VVIFPFPDDDTAPPASEQGDQTDILPSSAHEVKVNSNFRTTMGCRFRQLRLSDWV
jgi:hypothetical protein